MNRLAVALATIVSLCPLTALGQDSDNERARVHFSSGRSYFDEGNYERALEEFQQAYALSPLPLMLFNIGTTQERLGMLREAADTFERFLREVPDADNRDVLTRRIANLRSRAERIAAGHADPGEQTEVTTTTTTATAPRGGSGDGLVLGGIIGLGAVITGALALSAESSVQGGCYATRSCTPADVSDMDTFALATDILWPVAAVAAGAGAVLLLLGLSANGSGATAWIVPSLSPTAFGVTAGGSL